MKKTKQNMFHEAQSRKIIFTDKHGTEYMQLNFIVAIVLALLLPYVTVLLILLACFHILHMEIKRAPQNKKQTKSLKKH